MNAPLDSDLVGLSFCLDVLPSAPYRTVHPRFDRHEEWAMLAKRAERTVSSDDGPLDTLIGLNTFFEGTLKADNGVRIEGAFAGELFCSGSLTITASASVHADIEGMDVYVNGIVCGMVCAERVTLDREARLTGDIYTQTLSISEGALFSGSSAPLEEGTRDEQDGPGPEERLASS